MTVWGQMRDANASAFNPTFRPFISHTTSQAGIVMCALNFPGLFAFVYPLGTSPRVPYPFILHDSRHGPQGHEPLCLCPTCPIDVLSCDVTSCESWRAVATDTTIAFEAHTTTCHRTDRCEFRYIMSGDAVCHHIMDISVLPCLQLPCLLPCLQGLWNPQYYSAELSGLLDKCAGLMVSSCGAIQHI